MTGIICGTGSYVPSRVMDNNDIAKFVDTNDEWVRERTGIIRRHIVEEETTASMAAIAAQRALEQAKMDPKDIDLIILTTCSSNVVLPCTACEVQKLIGADNATCFDMNAACSGFVLAYNTATMYMAMGIYRSAIVIGSESLSNILDWTDRGTCILFGDGAGAVVMKADDSRFYKPVSHSNGNGGQALTLLNYRDGHKGEDVSDSDYFVHMDGQAVFKFAVRSIPSIVNEILENNQIEKDEIDWFVFHQANQRILEASIKRLKIPVEKCPMNLQEYGNTSSASVPILLDEMNRKGMFKNGQKFLMAGFGAGLTWVAAIAEWKVN